MWSIRTGEVGGRWPAGTPTPRELLRVLNSPKHMPLGIMRTLSESLPFDRRVEDINFYCTVDLFRLTWPSYFNFNSS